MVEVERASGYARVVSKSVKNNNGAGITNIIQKEKFNHGKKSIDHIDKSSRREQF